MLLDSCKVWAQQLCHTNCIIQKILKTDSVFNFDLRKNLVTCLELDCWAGISPEELEDTRLWVSNNINIKHPVWIICCNLTCCGLASFLSFLIFLKIFNISSVSYFLCISAEKEQYTTSNHRGKGSTWLILIPTNQIKSNHNSDLRTRWRRCQELQAICQKTRERKATSCDTEHTINTLYYNSEDKLLAYSDHVLYVFLC